MTQMEPLPVMETNPAVYMTISLFIGALHGGIFAYIRDSLPEDTIKSGLAYGGILWVLMALYFEFHAPFKMFGDPLQDLVMAGKALLALGLDCIAARP